MGRVQQIAGNDRLQRQLLILAVVLLPILGAALFKKNKFARLTFALITFFSLLNLLPLAVLSAIFLIPQVQWSDSNAVFFVVFAALIGPAFF